MLGKIMIKNCTECNGEVSSDAEACPHCGYRMKGREHLVRCQSCGNDVIPVVNPHDTVSRYCPICTKPVTNIGGRYLHIVIAVIFVVVVLLIVFGVISW
jgi:hypothetical protein